MLGGGGSVANMGLVLVCQRGLWIYVFIIMLLVNVMGRRVVCHVSTWGDV